MNTMIKVWDIPTRLFHWSLVILFIFMIVSGESDDLMEWHFYAGYLLAGLISFRLIWGFLGTRYARFSEFNLGPATVIRYTLGLLKAEHKPYYGHTPPGSVMIILLIGLLALQLVTGMLSTDDIIWNGPFYNSVSESTAELAGEIHETVQGLLQILVGLHVLAIILYKVKFKEALVPAMLHGKKPKHTESLNERSGVVSDNNREATSWIKLLLSALPAAGLSYWLFTLPI